LERSAPTEQADSAKTASALPTETAGGAGPGVAIKEGTAAARNSRPIRRPAFRPRPATRDDVMALPNHPPAALRPALAAGLLLAAVAAAGRGEAPKAKPPDGPAAAA